MTAALLAPRGRRRGELGTVISSTACTPASIDVSSSADPSDDLARAIAVWAFPLFKAARTTTARTNILAGAWRPRRSLVTRAQRFRGVGGFREVLSDHARLKSCSNDSARFGQRRIPVLRSPGISSSQWPQQQGYGTQTNWNNSVAARVPYCLMPTALIGATFRESRSAH